MSSAYISRGIRCPPMRTPNPHFAQFRADCVNKVAIKPRALWRSLSYSPLVSERGSFTDGESDRARAVAVHRLDLSPHFALYAVVEKARVVPLIPHRVVRLARVDVGDQCGHAPTFPVSQRFS